MEVRGDSNAELLRSIAHPSVRIKGTEDNFLPVPCNDQECDSKGIHMHCPFCVKTDLYHDARILKAHYRVKHVDKGIEFGGLKMLRCCEHCDIIGVIKGEKKFKGAHWHCYKCKNGFKRRDEAFKHYRTHFRHPYTTFQIHIPQEVNGAVIVQERRDDIADVSTDGLSYSVTSVLAGDRSAADCTITADSTLRKSTSMPMEVTKGTNGSVDVAVSDPSLKSQPAIMIIQEECLDTQSCKTWACISKENDSKEESTMQRIVLELKEQNEKLKLELEKQEKFLKAEIEQLKSQLQLQSQELERIQQREQELRHQLSVPMDNKMRQLMNSLQTQHTEMLQQHLLQVKKEAYLSAVKDLQNGTIMATVDASGATGSNILTGRDQQSVVALVLDSSGSLLSQSLPVSSYNLTPVSQCSDRAAVTAIGQISGQTIQSSGVSVALSSAPVLNVNSVEQPIVSSSASANLTYSRNCKASLPMISQSQVVLTMPSAMADKVTSEHLTLPSTGSDSNSAKHILTSSNTPLIISGDNTLPVSQSFPLAVTNESLSNLRASLNSTTNQSLLMAVHPDSSTPLLVARNCPKATPLGIVMRDAHHDSKSAQISNDASLSRYLTTCDIALVSTDTIHGQEIYSIDSTNSVSGKKNEINEVTVATHLTNNAVFIRNKDTNVCSVNGGAVEVLNKQETAEKRKTDDVMLVREKKKKESALSA